MLQVQSENKMFLRIANLIHEVVFIVYIFTQ